MSDHINKVRIKVVSNALRSLNEKVVFVGGATVSLYSERTAFEIRPTDDVDVIIELLNYKDRTELDEKLRSFGFTNDIESGIVCRYKIQGLIVDVMPTNDPSIGFENKWYPEGFEEAIEYYIDNNSKVKILSPPYFIATKIEAFKGRGKNDGRTSKDFEDIVFVLENRTSIWDEMKNSNEELLKYLKYEFQLLLKVSGIYEWIGSHVERGPNPSTERILKNLKKFCDE